MKLLIEDDQGNRSVVPVIRDEITIGRNEANTIRLTERNVSRRHARLVHAEGRLFVEDVKARYGIKKNGKKIDERAEFNEGDVVVIGDYRLTLRPEQADGAHSGGVNGEAAAEISDGLADQEVLGEESSAAHEQVESGGQETSSRAETEVIQTEPAELVVISSNFAGQNFPLDGEEMVIGRSEDCDIIIDHRSVSSTHAKIVREGHESYKIVDLNSRNGLTVDGEDYKSVHLERGDILELGHVKFRFVAPGENYVFSPQASSEAISVEEPAEGIGVSPWLLGGIGVGVLVVGAVLVMALGSSGGQEEANARAAADSPEARQAGTQPAANSAKVDKTIDQAHHSIEAGKLDKAIGSLESIRDLLEPTGKQQDRIAKLLSTARREQPFRNRYSSARQSLDKENYAEALEALDHIPDHSVFFELARENNLESRALDGLITNIKGAVDKGNAEKARTKAEVAMEYQSHKSAASKALAKLQTVKEEAPARQPSEPSSPAQEGGGPLEESQPSDEPAEKPESAGRPAGGSSGSSGGGSRDEITRAEAKELFQSATKQWVRGDHAGAIGDCRRALRVDYHPCYRVIGMANKQMGNKAAACKYFRRYLQSDPSGGSKIRSMMDELKCEGRGAK